MIALDIDGTLLDYGSHGATRINTDLVASLPRGVDIVLVTNQGGLPFGLTNHRFPSVRQFVERLATIYRYMAACRKPFSAVYVCVYHPLASPQAIQSVAHQVRGHIAIYPRWRVYATSRARKPSPLMLRAAGATIYYGDSPEDAKAALAASIPFVPVCRFE